MNVCLKCSTKGQVGIRLEEHDFEVCCKNCRVRLVELDDNIADIILLLNDKSFKTIHSCEGHLYVNDKLNIPNRSTAEGYITIEDDGTCEKKLSFIPDTIGNYKLTYELCSGPRSFENRTIVNKFVLRFVRDDFRTIDFWSFQLEKVKMFDALERLLIENLGE